MPTRYFYHRGTEQQGPVDERELRELIAAGSIRPETLIWQEGTPDWVAAGSVHGLFSADAHAGETPPPLPAPGARSATSAPGWRRTLAHEVCETARATAAQINRLASLGSARWVDHRLSRQAVAAQAEFGQRLHEGGLGDAELRNRLAQLDEQIASLEWTKGSTREAEAERRGLLVRLAAPYLREAPPAGLEPEHSRARTALVTEQEAHNRAIQEQAALLPADTSQRRRLAMGAAVLGLIAVSVVWLVLSGLWSGWPGDDEHPSMLLGDWEGRTEWIITFTTRFEFEPEGRVVWHQDFGAIAPQKEGSGTWRVNRVEATRYTLEMVNDLQPDETSGWVIVFNGDDEFTITGFDDIPITVQRRK